MAGHLMSAWEVAAAILLIEGEAIHVNSLCRRVLTEGLSGLGKRGGRTTPNTLGREMRENEVFQPHGNGYYQLGYPHRALKMPAVRNAINIIGGKELERYLALVRRILEERIDITQKATEKLKAELTALESKCARVARLYSPSLAS